MFKIVKAILFELSAILVAFTLVFYGFCFLKISFAHAAEPAMRVIDGDTVASPKTTYRLQNYDAPEIFHYVCQKEKDLGLQAKQIVVDLVANNPHHIVSTGKKEKYGRTLATLYIDYPTGKRSTGDILIEKNLAYAYMGKGPKKDWCK